MSPVVALSPDKLLRAELRSVVALQGNAEVCAHSDWKLCVLHVDGCNRHPEEEGVIVRDVSCWVVTGWRDVAFEVTCHDVRCQAEVE